MFKKMNSKMKVKGEKNISQHITFRLSILVSPSTENITGERLSHIKISIMIFTGVKEKNFSILLATFIIAERITFNGVGTE